MALFVAFAVTFSGNGAPHVSAVFTPTNTPAGTPKPNGAGPITGLTDLDVGPRMYKCIAYTAQDSVNTAQVKAALQCYTYFDAALSGSEPPCGAQHATGGGATPVVPGEGNCAGHSGSPPYSLLPPAKAIGTYSSAAAGTVSLLTCIEDIGGTLGPNAIAQLTYSGADAFAAAPDGTTLSTTVSLWLQQDNATCTAAENGTAPGSTPSTLPTNITKRPISRDFDSDGCSDKDELLQNKPGFAAGKCGDDPWNPLDTGSGSPLDVSGSYDIVARVVRNDLLSRGYYYDCKADVQQLTKALTARALCYIDAPGIVVNPQVAGKAEDISQCGNATDDDSDGLINDGCPGAPNPESGIQCLNNIDDDSDGYVNDGCPASGPAETGGQCLNNTDDDLDGLVNDGCPAQGFVGETGAQCSNATDDDADGKINDGCPAMGALHTSCPPAVAKYCGDGIPGSAPPGCSQAGQIPSAPCATLAGQGAGCPSLPCDVSQYQFADIDDKEAVLTGTLDNTSNTMELAGCLEDRDGNGALGNIYVVAKIDAHTGIGAANIFTAQSTPNCTGGTPSGSPATAQLEAVRQAPGAKGLCTPNITVGYTGCRDSDGDGCPDTRELADEYRTGGLRDPMNRWDYFNPEKVATPHLQTVADIIFVEQKFGKNQGNVQYTIDADRTPLIGANVWNLGPADGQETVADILAAIKQYHEDC